MYSSDVDIRKAIKDALLIDPRVNPFDIELRVKGAVVTLRGQVDNFAEKSTAEANAFEGGATGVVDNLTVQ